MDLTIEFTEFKIRIDEFVEKAEELKKRCINTNDELEDYKTSIKDWEQDCARFLILSFDGDNSNCFPNSFKETGRTYHLGLELSLAQIAQNLKTRLSAKASILPNIVKFIEISDNILRRDIVEKENRINWTIYQKKIFLLKVLNELNDGQYYDSQYIFQENGIVFKNPNEAIDLVTSLSKKGYVEVIGSLLASITIEGVEYLESESMKSQSTKNEKSESEKNDIDIINEKLDSLINLVNINNWGNEILFEEIQELRKAGKSLNLKNWTQLAKGKFMDLAQSNLEDFGKEKLKEMFNTLVDEGTKLIGL